jgi:hypothetical protein
MQDVEAWRELTDQPATGREASALIVFANAVSTIGVFARRLSQRPGRDVSRKEPRRE